MENNDRKITVIHKVDRANTELMADTSGVFSKGQEDAVVGESPGVPVVRTLCFHCTGQGFNAWLGN